MTKKSLTFRQEFGNKKTYEIDKKKKWEEEQNRSYRSKAKKELSLELKRKGDRYRTMSYETIQKMIHRLLTQNRIDLHGKIRKRYSREELSEKLGITVSEFKKLGSTSAYESIKEKITLPLVSLYCSIRWVSDKRKKRFFE